MLVNESGSPGAVFTCSLLTERFLLFTHIVQGRVLVDIITCAIERGACTPCHRLAGYAAFLQY